MVLSMYLAELKRVTKRFPLTRGMLAYAILYPAGSVLQQLLEGKNFHNMDYIRCVRSCVFGAFLEAPAIYGWVKLSSAMWPYTNFKVGLMKALTEQISYGPFSITSYYISMNLLEFRTLSAGFHELKHKFLPTWQVGVSVWPFLQTVNFSLIRERNRVVFVCICSVLWTTFLAYMKQLDTADLAKSKLN